MAPEVWIVLGWTLIVAGPATIVASLFEVSATGRGKAPIGGAILMTLFGGGLLSAHHAAPEASTFWTVIAASAAITAVLAWIARYGEAPRSAPASAEGEPVTAMEVRPPPFDVLLCYRDGRRAASERRVTIHRIVLAPDAAGEWQIERLHGWCHLRRGARIFVFARIEELADAETGEIVDPTAFLLTRIGRLAHR